MRCIAGQTNYEETECLDAQLPAESNSVDDDIAADRLAADVLLDLHFGAFNAKVDSITARGGHRFERILIDAVGTGFTLPFENEAAPANLIANLNNTVLTQREHWIPKEDVLNLKILDEMLDFIDDVFR